ncbi:hypothetical protein Acsp06_61830 [Actinomycetospora sp. NBRC 106375]|nr:hypothetical protein Acsp06_61830 [Actinomycetospora sp. NBRC 106375]
MRVTTTSSATGALLGIGGDREKGTLEAGCLPRLVRAAYTTSPVTDAARRVKVVMAQSSRRNGIEGA